MSIHMNMFVTVHATAPCVSEPAGHLPVIFWPRHLVLSREQHDKQRVRVRVRAMPLMGASFFDLDIGGCWRSSYRYCTVPFKSKIHEFATVLNSVSFNDT